MVARQPDPQPAESERTENRPEVPSLSQLYAYLTDGCNLACRHCWLAPALDATGRSAAMLPVEAFESVIRQAKPLGLHTVKLTGGEPLLHPRIDRFLEIVHREELRLGIETNGLLCTREIATRIARCKESSVAVSVDGADAATHEAVRGVPGSFQSALRGIRELTAAGIRPQIIMSVLRLNAEQVDDVVRLAERLGASSVKFNVVQPTGRGKQLRAKGFLLDVPELIALGRRVDMEISTTTDLSLYFDYPQAFRPLSRMFGSNGCGTCNIIGILGLLPSAKYALCGIGEHIPELVFGSVESDPLQDVWAGSGILQTLRAGLPGRLEGVCSRCLMKDACLGSCIADNYYRARNLWAPFWFCEQAEELGIFPTSRLTPAPAAKDAGAATTSPQGEGGNHGDERRGRARPTDGGYPGRNGHRPSIV